MGEASLDVVEQLELQHPDAKQRALLWKQIVTKHASDKGGHTYASSHSIISSNYTAWVDEHAAALTQLVCAAAAAQGDATTTRAASAAVHAALHSGAPAFLRTLSAALVKAAALPSLLPGHALLLVRWVSAVLQSIDAAAADKAAPKLLQCQGTFMAAITPPSASHSLWAAAVHSVLNMLRTTPALLPAYIAAANAHPGPALAHAVALHVAKHASDQTTAGKPQEQSNTNHMVQLYCSRVLSSKDVLNKDTYCLYAALLANATPAAVEEALLPAATRSIKQRPEQGLHGCTAMLGALPTTDSLAAPLLPVLLQQARHAREAVQVAAAAAVEALVAGMHTTAALEQMAKDALHVLDGRTDGKLKSTGERCGVAHCLTIIAQGRWGSGTTAVAGEVVEGLAALFEEERTEEGKLSLATALGAWTALCTVAAAAVARFTHGLTKEKEAVKRAHLHALLQALRQPAAVDQENGRGNDRGKAKAAPRFQPASPNAVTVASLGPPMTPLLLKVVSEGLTKATARADGLSAALALTLAAEEPSVTAELTKDEAWAKATAPGSVYFQDATLAKLTPDDAIVAAQVLGRLLTVPCLHQPASMPAHARALVLLQLHHDGSTRLAAAHVARAAVAAGHGSLLLDALVTWQEQALDAAALLAAPQESGEGSGPALGAVAPRMAAALAAIAPPVWDAPLLARLLLAAHHSSIAVGQGGSQVAWGALHRALGAEAVASVLDGHAAEVVACLLDPAYAAPWEARTGAVAAALSAARSEATRAALFAALLPQAAAMVDREAHDALTAEELLIFQTPAGTLSWEAAGGKSLLPDMLQGAMLQAVGKGAKGGTGQANGAPSKAPAKAASKAVSKAAPASKGSKGPTSKSGNQQEAMRQEHLAREAEVRASVERVRSRLAQGLELVAAIAQGSARFAHEHLSALTPLVTPLLPSPLVGDGAALTAIQALVSTSPTAVASRAICIAAGLRLAALAAQERETLTPAALSEEPIVIDCVHTLAKAASTAPLPPPTYRLCFPLIATLLAAPHHTPHLDTALDVLTQHVSPDLDLPREAALQSLYHVLGVLPSYTERVQPLLRALCAGCLPEQLPGAVVGVLAPHPLVRAEALRALPDVPALAEGLCPDDVEVVSALWVARHDVQEAVADLGNSVWLLAQCELREVCMPMLLRHTCQSVDDVSQSAAIAVARALLEFPSMMTDVLTQLIAAYDEAPTASRAGAARTLAEVAPLFSPVHVDTVLRFLLTRALADPDEGVRVLMVRAGRLLVDAHGAALGTAMVPLLDSHLEQQQKDDAESDMVREGAVVFLGTLASHLNPGDPKVNAIMNTLLDVLTTPSEPVQRAVAGCLPPLTRRMAAQGPTQRAAVKTTVVDVLLKRALQGTSYGDRRGAAFGLAGAVQGLSIQSLNGCGIMAALQAGVENKASANTREGALFVYEALSERLERLFEPWVASVVPLLLVAFGDSSAAVREATAGAAATIMRQLTGHGVKLVLPVVLKGCEDKAWRTKQGSVQLLGAMRACAPQQLATALPTVVPRLAEVLADPHPKVQAAAKDALNQVASIIKNPEVSMLVPVLLSALASPNQHSKEALEILLTTTFVNTIDAASLALIVPVVYRGLRDRAGDVRRRASMIVGNMSALVNEPKDLAPYVPMLMPEIKTALVDPLPEVRAVAAKALGSLFKGMGDAYLEELLPWLLDLLRSEGGAVERSGAAQGLAEVLRVAGATKVEALLPGVLEGCRSKSASAREGYLTLFKFLPLVMAQGFQPYVGRVLPAVLDGLADENEGVREAALAAGRTLVELYAATSQQLLLPAVETGIVDDNWRIRHSSVELLGDLLFKVAGTSGRIQVDTTHDEDEGISTEAHAQAIVAALGSDRRNQVLARIYLARSDVSYAVRNAALHVWKSLVSNTPRTLTEIMPALMDLMIRALASDGEDLRTASGKCLGEIVRKLGDRVLNQIIPILTMGIRDANPATREGVCYGLKEVLDGVSRHQLTDHLAELLPAVQAALTDDSPAVRQAAGQAFGVLFKGAGNVMDSVIPSLLMSLEAGGAKATQALEGLRVILGVKPTVLASIVPKLLKPPAASARIRALGALAEAAGGSIHPHLGAVVPQLLTMASAADDGLLKPTAQEALASVAAATQEDGMYTLISELCKAAEEPDRRTGVVRLVQTWAPTAKAELQEHVGSLLLALVPLLAEPDDTLVNEAWAAVNAVALTIPKETQPAFVRVLRDGVDTAADKQRRRRAANPDVSPYVPGLCLPKALAPLLPIYLQGILQGSAELREMAAEGLGTLLELTPPEGVKPFTVQVTGPLIRIMGDRFPGETRAALLYATGVVMARAGIGLKPFVPQLQTTFVKSLSDQARAVRQRAAANLGALSVLSTRVDQLVADLAASAVAAEPAVRDGHLAALRGCLTQSGTRLQPDTLTKVKQAVVQLLPMAGEDEQLVTETAQCLGVYMTCCPPSELGPLLAQPLANAQSGADWASRWTAGLVLSAALQHAASGLAEQGLTDAITAAIVKVARDPQEYVRLAAGRAAGHALVAQGRGTLPPTVLTTLTPVLVALLGADQSSDVQRMGLLVIRRACGARAALFVPSYAALVPSLCALIKGSMGPIKLAAERALGTMLQVEQTQEPVQQYLASGGASAVVKQMFTETYLRRLATLPAGDNEEQL